MNVRTELAETIRERLRIIGDEASRADPERHMQRLREASERISALQQQLPTSADPQLAHFLQRGSYVKALEYLDAYRE